MLLSKLFSSFSPDVREFLSLDNPKNAPVQDDDIDDTDEKVDEVVSMF